MTGAGVTRPLPTPTVTGPTSEPLYGMHRSVLMRTTFTDVPGDKGEGAR
jgi:hypothetical protein